MAKAEFSVIVAGPLITFQDAGRPKHMRYGVPASGPMDHRISLDAAHVALGNVAGQTAIEILLGGLALKCIQDRVTVAITGGNFSVNHAGKKLRSWAIQTVSKGDILTLRGGVSGSWAYLAFADALQSAGWLSNAATHSLSGLGGGALQAGQPIVVHDADQRRDREGDIPRSEFRANGPIRVVVGPQDHHFAQGATAQFLTATYRISQAFDWMGLRLDGPAFALDGALSIPSESVLRGSVQVSGDGAAPLRSV